MLSVRQVLLVLFVVVEVNFRERLVFLLYLILFFCFFLSVFHFDFFAFVLFDCFFFLAIYFSFFAFCIDLLSLVLVIVSCRLLDSNYLIIAT